MKHRALVSIVIPVYQAESTLRRCLDSVLYQTYAHWEALAVNDGSKDRSADILLEYSQDTRIRFFNCKNSGVAAARNVALTESHGEWVTFLDSDDWWEPDMLERMLQAALVNHADIVQSNYRYDYDTGATYVPHPIFMEGQVIDRSDFGSTLYRRMTAGMQLNHVCHMFYRASILIELRMMEKLRTGEDLLFNVYAIPRAKRYVYIADPLYHYFCRADSLTGSSLSIRVKFQCNRYIARQMAAALPQWDLNTFRYRLRAYLRPYRLIFSKLYRMLQNRLVRSMNRPENE